jgi:hypothetical protein
MHFYLRHKSKNLVLMVSIIAALFYSKILRGWFGALDCRRLAKCAMWVGFPSSFFAGGGTNQSSIKFALSCQKAKFFLILILSISYLSVVCPFTRVANVWALGAVADFGAQNYHYTLKVDAR